MRTPGEQTARILHGSARHFVLCSACKCQNHAPNGQFVLRQPLILLRELVLPDRIELSTSPLPMECSTTELRQRARIQESAKKGPYKAADPCHKAPSRASARDRSATPAKPAKI